MGVGHGHRRGQCKGRDGELCGCVVGGDANARSIKNEECSSKQKLRPLLRCCVAAAKAVAAAVAAAAPESSRLSRNESIKESRLKTHSLNQE